MWDLEKEGFYHRGPYFNERGVPQGENFRREPYLIWVVWWQRRFNGVEQEEREKGRF